MFRRGIVPRPTKPIRNPWEKYDPTMYVGPSGDTSRALYGSQPRKAGSRPELSSSSSTARNDRVAPFSSLTIMASRKIEGRTDSVHISERWE